MVETEICPHCHCLLAGYWDFDGFACLYCGAVVYNEPIAEPKKKYASDGWHHKIKK